MLSDKLAIVANNPKMAKHVQNALAEVGQHCKIDANVRDLSVDNTAGKKRGKKEHTSRCAKAKHRARKSKWMA